MQVCLKHWLTSTKRQVFEVWRKKHSLTMVAVDVDTYGPTTEEVLHYRCQKHAYLQFLRDEAYTEKEIGNVQTEGEARQQRRFR